MAGLVRITSVWTGFPGAPGYTNLYARHNGVSAQDVADQFADDISAFWTAIDSFLPEVVTVTVDPTWVAIEETNGQIQSSGSLATPPAAVVGTQILDYAGNVGVAIDWHTSAFIAGHRLKGRTYIVPAAGCFEGNGTLDSLYRQAFVDAATDLYDNSSIMVIWHRPVNGTGGSSSEITSVTVSDRAAVLRSRSV